MRAAGSTNSGSTRKRRRGRDRGLHSETGRFGSPPDLLTCAAVSVRDPELWGHVWPAAQAVVMHQHHQRPLV